jgi:subtilase family serine protease/flagellar hook assembly protein FlgD
VASEAFDVQLFDGDPEAGGGAIGAPALVDSLEGGGSRVLTFSWDTGGLAGFEGPHTLFAIADFVGAIPEVSKKDNVATREVEVLPPLANLVVAGFTLDPPAPIEGSVANLAARVANTGSAIASATQVRWFRELPRLGIELGEAAVPSLAPGGVVEVSIPWDTAAQIGDHTLFARVDPDDDVRERFETDNDASLAIDVRTPPPAQPDLEIRGFTLIPSALERLPQDVAASARITNTGLEPVGSALVELFQGHPDQGGVRVGSTTIPVGGDTGVDVVIDFTVTTGGSRTLFLRVDAAPTVERDVSNNVASAVLRDLMDVVDVALVPGSVALSATSLDPGQLLSVDVSVINTGTRPLSSVPVALFYELAAGDGYRLASSRNVPLEPGASAVVTLTWRANRSGTVPLEIRVDPDDVLSETHEADNVVVTSVDVSASTLPNLSVASSAITVTPTPLVEGMSGSVRAIVRNLGDVDASAFQVSFFAGDPARDGFLLGSTSFAGLPGSGEVLASVAWDPVNVRGESLVFVDVDSGAAVEEIDETDNVAFHVVDVTGLAEIVATAAQLRLTPAYARSGDLVSIDASFTNTGEQSAAPMAVELRLDDPVSGALIAAEEIGAVAAGDTGGFVSTWDTSGLVGAHALYLVLDVRNDVREQREDNNVVRAPIALQDADVFVTPTFFSPNGDGVQDEAALFYRVSAAGALRVEVRDDEESVIRELAASSDGGASVVWDGRRDDGARARDGAYFFVLFDDGAELVRRRVVLDTNHSSVVEALGSDLVSLTQLTCPLPGELEGPAWLPNDNAAYVIVSSEDAIDAPDYPVGLYRVSSDASSIELVLDDEAFADVEFVTQIPGARNANLNPVSADGEHALARSGSDGALLIVELATGARTSLGHDGDGSAMWTSDGQRILVGSSAGLLMYDANGSLLQTLVAESVYSALLAPDELRIVYRRTDEIFLRIVNVDGSNDRVIESSDATLYFEQAPPPLGVDLDEFYFLEGQPGPVFAWFFQTREEGAGPFLVDLAADTVTDAHYLGVVSSDERWELETAGSLHVVRRRSGRDVRPVIPFSLGGGVRWSYRDTHLSYIGAGGEGCVGIGSWVVRSLLNGEADLRLTRLPSRFGVRISGSVSDQNLESYSLEFASVATPNAFTPIQPPSDTPVIADTITTWIPPGPGDYLVRLTLRDKAGNTTARLDRIFWEETLPIASLRRAPTYVSPNGNGAQDVVLVEYDVLTPANLVFHIRDVDGRSVREIPRDELVPGPASFTWDGTDQLDVPVDDGHYTLTIAGAEFPIVVDRASPFVAAAYSDLYTDDTKKPRVRLAVDLEGRILDDNLTAWELVTAEGEVVFSAPREVGTPSELGVILERFKPVQGLELRARDRAGNETTFPLSGPTREIRVLRVRSVPIGSFVPGPASAVGAVFVRPSLALSLTA